MSFTRLWCHVSVVGLDGAELFERDLVGTNAPDMETVDQLARLTLLADRLRGHIVVTELADELRQLLELAGLTVEMQRQTEARKESFGLQMGQEEAHPDDSTI